MCSDVNDKPSSKGNFTNYEKLKEVEEEQEVQQIIDVALIEMNNGNYNKAISLLDKANELYGSERSTELQQLIIKLQSNVCRNNANHRTSDSKMPPLRRRKYDSEKENVVTQEHEFQSDFTHEQLDLVKRVNSCKNYYDVLEVSRNASASEIKKSYKKLALILHPDKNHAPGSVEAFKNLGNAMTILTDCEKRKEYNLSGGDYITSNGSSFNISKNNFSSQQQHHYNCTSEENAFFNGEEELTADELFHMFFNNYTSSQTHYRRRPYQFANQRQPQEVGQQPTIGFGLLLVMILMSIFFSFLSLFSTDPLYSLSHSSKYNVRRQTQHLSIPYYVKENFNNEYQGSLARFENSVEEDYVYSMKQHCFRERSYRQAMMARARSFGSRAQFAQAQGLKMPSCENLSKIGITRYSLY